MTISPISFTTIVGIDDHHVKELEMSYKTWKEYRPELFEQPLLLVCDADISPQEWNRRLHFLDHPDQRRVQWSLPDATQREKMLNGVTLVAGTHVHTPWYFKLDTDSIADAPGDWIQESWFQPNEHGELPAFISHPLNVTKISAISRLEEWSKGIPDLNKFAPFELRNHQRRNFVHHRRIVSWCFWGRTDWTKEVLGYCNGRLPVPSHDTYLSYCATKRNDFIRRASMKACGWTHKGRYASFQRYFANRQNQRNLDHKQGSSPKNTVSQPANTAKIHKPSPQAVEHDQHHSRGQAGVFYLLSGPAYAARLVASLWSLRKHYSGPVVIYAVGDKSQSIAREIQSDHRLNVECRDFPRAHRRKNASYLTKLAILQNAPFERTCYLDADTVVAGSIDELLAMNNEEQIVATQFATWTSAHRKVQKRIKNWLRLDTEGKTKSRINRLVRSALRSRPAVNGGVFTVRSDSELASKWYDLAIIGKTTFICDEIALQLLLHHHPRKILDCRWNCSPIYAKDTDDVRIWHMHGSKHLRENARPIWLPIYEECLAENVAQIAEWTPAGDRRLKRFIEQRQSVINSI